MASIWPHGGMFEPDMTANLKLDQVSRNINQL